MIMQIAAGHYLIAVSGGIDSVVLLHMLRQHPGVRLTVAHFDHGIRPGSADDAAFVANVARSYGLPFVTDRVELGPGASEAAARTARYQFLRTAAQTVGAQGIITAHHQDDVLETAVFNIIRGTGRRGLTSLRSTDAVVRPMLATPKSSIIQYAEQNGLAWREDSTNQSDIYSRNYIRHTILSKFTNNDRRRLIKMLAAAVKSNQLIDDHLDDLLSVIGPDTTLSRMDFIKLPHQVAKEVMASWLRRNEVTDISTAMLDRLVQAAKTYYPPSRVSVNKNRVLHITKTDLALQAVER